MVASAGSYPRIGDSPDLQILRRTIAAVDRGERTAADLAGAESEMARRAIQEQVQAGVDLLTDGLIRWYDPISHLAGKLSGVQIRGLLRFFDTNTYFRQPVLTARPMRTQPLVLEDFRFASNALGSVHAPAGKNGRLGVKMVLTGPYTLAKFSLAEDAAMKPLEARAMAYAEALAAEIRDLAQAGAPMIQVDEPAILKYPQDWAVFAKSLGVLAGAREEGKVTQLALHTCFHDGAPAYEKLITLPVDVLGIDFTYNPKMVDVVAAAGSPIPLSLGLVDGRNTRLEDPGAVAKQIEKLLPRIVPARNGVRAYLSTSCGLEYLPRDRAYAKLELLSKIAAITSG